MVQTHNIEDLVVEYVLRQQLVFDAIAELRPDKFAIEDKSISDHEVATLADAYKHVPDKGVWKRYGVWNYTMHGSGCRLIGIITGEPIEWDVPDKDVFEHRWFLNWCRWLKKINSAYNSLPDESFDKVFKALEQRRIIEPSHAMSPYKWRLLV